MKRNFLTILLALTVISSISFVGCGTKSVTKKETVKEDTTDSSYNKNSDESKSNEEDVTVDKNEDDYSDSETDSKDENGIDYSYDENLDATKFSHDAGYKEKAYKNTIKLNDGVTVGFNRFLCGWDLDKSSTSKKVILKGNVKGFSVVATLSDSGISIGDKSSIQSFLSDFSDEHFSTELFTGEDVLSGDGFNGIAYSGAKTNGKNKMLKLLVPNSGKNYLSITIKDTGNNHITTMDVFETLLQGIQEK